MNLRKEEHVMSFESHEEGFILLFVVELYLHFEVKVGYFFFV